MVKSSCALAGGRVAAGDGDRGGDLLRDFFGEARARKVGEVLVERLREHVLEDLAHHHQRPVLDALAGADDGRVGGQVGGGQADDVADGVRRRHRDHALRALESDREIVGRLQRAREGVAGEVGRVLALRFDIRGARGVVRPEARLVALAREQERERRTPAPRSDHGDACGHGLPPDFLTLRRSIIAGSRLRAYSVSPCGSSVTSKRSSIVESMLAKRARRFAQSRSSFTRSS